LATSSEEPGAGSGPAPRPSRGLREAVAAALPKERFGDHLTLLSGTGQNIVGLAVFVLASLGTSVLISHALGSAAFGVVTLATQIAFVGGAGTRFGMDMAAVRRVAIDVGKGEPGRARAVVRRAAGIAAAVSVVVGIALFAAAPWLGNRHGDSTGAFQAAALAMPFVALCQVYLGGTRGLKVMRHTLYVYWAGQPVAWIAFTLLAWSVSRSVGATVLAYAVSWAAATLAGWWLWLRETRAFPRLPAEPGETSALIRYGAPRAPAALLSQALFWTDYFVLSVYVARGPSAGGAVVTAGDLGVYAAAVRVAQALVLFLIAVNYMFSPFVADLHARQERERLDGLYKALTRWTLAGTLPLLLLLLIVPGPILTIFGAGFTTGTTALRILLVGQLVNVAVGSVGFILIMVGRTGWDLTVYAGSFLLDLAIAVVLVPHLGMNGAAIAQTSTLTVSNAVRLWLVWRLVHIQPFNRHYVRLVVPAFAAGVVMVAVHLALGHAAWPVDLFATGAAGLVVYVAVLALAGLTPTERDAAGRILRRSPHAA
jgi:O-antigen/teichoic acid export membrane protein